METITKRILGGLGRSIDDIQSNTIGFAEVHGRTELVLERTEHTTLTITVAPLLGLHTLHFENDQFRTVLFPEGKTLANMKENPHQFYDWRILNNF